MTPEEWERQLHQQAVLYVLEVNLQRFVMTPVYERNAYVMPAHSFRLLSTALLRMQKQLGDQAAVASFVDVLYLCGMIESAAFIGFQRNLNALVGTKWLADNAQDVVNALRRGTISCIEVH